MPRITIPLWEWQKDAVRNALRRDGRYGLFMEMGTGKTRTGLAIAQGLLAKRIVLLVPLAAVEVWREEMHGGLDKAALWPQARLLFGTEDTLRERARMVRAVSKTLDDNPTFLFVNYESYWKEPLRTAILKHFDPDMIIADEAHRLKHRSSKQSRFAHVLAAHVPYRVPLTGTPQTHGLEDYYSILRFLDPDLLGGTWAEFAQRYIVMGGYKGKEIVDYINTDELTERVHAGAFRYTKDEAFGPSNPIDIRIPVKLSKKTRAAYDEMEAQSLAEIDGVGADGMPLSGTALARIILTNVLRLQQITSGFAKVEETDENLYLGTEKLDVLADKLTDVLEGTSHVVVFAHFKPDIARIADVLRKKFPKATVGVLDGSVPKAKRPQIKAEWAAAECGILVGQIAVTSLALDFTRASTVFFYSLDRSLEHYLQARSRIDRHGQLHTPTFYHLVAQKTVDEDIYASHARREDLATTVLDRSRMRSLFTHGQQP